MKLNLWEKEMSSNIKKMLSGNNAGGIGKLYKWL